MNLIEHTLANGGGTFDRATGNPVNLSSGYAVAIAGLGQQVPVGDLTEDVVAAYLANMPTTPDLYAGTWISDGLVYLDTTQVFVDRAAAISAARARNELAIWDFAANAEVSAL